jgi:hypothetical protein
MKKLAIALSTGTLAAGIVAGLLWKQLVTEREQLAELRASVTAMEKAQGAALSSAHQAPPATVPASGQPATDAAPTPGAAAPGTNADSRGQGIVRGLAEAMASPEASDMIRGQVRAALTQQFPDLATELRLNPAESEKLMDLLTKQASSATSDALGMMSGGPAAQDSQRKLVEKQLASEKEIASMLGNRYPAWQDYQGTALARQEISQLRSLLGTGPDALTEAQTKPLVAAIGAERTRINKEEQNRMSTALRSSQNINLLEDQLKNMPAQSERLVNAASSHLSGSQLDRYKRMLAQQENMLRAVMGTMGAGANAAGQAGAPR